MSETTQRDPKGGHGSASVPPQSRTLAAISRMWMGICESIFAGPGARLTTRQRWFQRAWIGGLLVAILGFWTYFLNFGQFAFGVQDWIWEWRYSRILRLALLAGRLPLHTQPAASYGIDRFLAIPDVPLGPQLIFLRFLDLGPAALATMLLMVLIGFVGCLLLRRRENLSPFSFTILAVLVNFNGFIVAHLGIGHTLFSGYFLLPFFVLLVLQIVDGDEGRGWVAWVGLVLFGIELQGSTQIFAVCMIFLGILFLVFTGRRRKILLAMLAGVILNLYRIIPGLISLSSYTNRPQPGFISLTELSEGLLRIVPPSMSSKLMTGLPLGWWELDVFVGILGLAFLGYFGVYRVWIESGKIPHGPGLPVPLGISLLSLGLFSIGYIYWPINFLPIPLLSLVHVPTRFFILPLLVLTGLGARTLQQWLDARKPGPGLQIALLAMLLLLTHDLFQHARQWRVEHVFEAFPPAALDNGLKIVARYDPTYVSVLTASAAVSGLALLVYLVLALGGTRRRLTQGSS